MCIETLPMKQTNVNIRQLKRFDKLICGTIIYLDQDAPLRFQKYVKKKFSLSNFHAEL